MPLCGTTFDKKTSPLDKRDFRGVFENWNKPTPTTRDRVKSSQDFTFASLLPRSGFSGELSALECAAAFSVDTWLALACWRLNSAYKQLGHSAAHSWATSLGDGRQFNPSGSAT